MPARFTLHITVGAAATLALGGCSQAAAPIEPEPGELDYDVAVTRTALVNEVTRDRLAYNPWTNEAFDPASDEIPVAVDQDTIDSGIEALCATIEGGDQDGLPLDWYYGAAAQEAVNGAVIASASEDFREAFATSLMAGADHEVSDDERARYEEATQALKGDLHAEWVELYDLQSSLQQQAMTLEGAEAVQAAMAERCDADAPDDAPDPEPAQQINQWLLTQPPATTD